MACKSNLDAKNKNEFIPKYYEKTLKNGLKIIAVPYGDKSRVVSVNIFYKVGSKDEYMGKSGIAHMLEHLNFKSTKNLKAGEFDKIVNGFGGSNNAATGFDYTNYYIKCATKNLDKSLYLFSELMANLKLKDSEFQTERKVVLQEQKMRVENDPHGFLYFKVFSNLYEYSSYHWMPIGFSEDIKHWNIKDIREFHDRYYSPNNAILVVAGDISKDEVFKLAKKHFKNIKNKYKKPPKRNHMIEPIIQGDKNAVYYKDIKVDSIAIAYRIPKEDAKTQAALDMIGEVLTSGKSSKLYKPLMQDKQISTSFYAYNMELEQESVFIFFAKANVNVDANVIKNEFLKALQELKTTPVKQEVIDRIRKNNKKDFVMSLQSASSLSDTFGSYLIKNNINSLYNYEKNINSITPKFIQKVANEYLKYPTTIILKNEKLRQ